MKSPLPPEEFAYFVQCSKCNEQPSNPLKAVEICWCTLTTYIYIYYISYYVLWCMQTASATKARIDGHLTQGDFRCFLFPSQHNCRLQVCMCMQRNIISPSPADVRQYLCDGVFYAFESAQHWRKQQLIKVIKENNDNGYCYFEHFNGFLSIRYGLLGCMPIHRNLLTCECRRCATPHANL